MMEVPQLTRDICGASDQPQRLIGGGIKLPGAL
jgi:hypothetical protein